MPTLSKENVDVLISAIEHGVQFHISCLHDFANNTARDKTDAYWSYEEFLMKVYATLVDLEHGDDFEQNELSEPPKESEMMSRFIDRHDGMVSRIEGIQKKLGVGSVAKHIDEGRRAVSDAYTSARFTGSLASQKVIENPFSDAQTALIYRENYIAHSEAERAAIHRDRKLTGDMRSMFPPSAEFETHATGTELVINDQCIGHTEDGKRCTNPPLELNPHSEKLQIIWKHLGKKLSNSRLKWCEQHLPNGLKNLQE